MLCFYPPPSIILSHYKSFLRDESEECDVPSGNITFTRFLSSAWSFEAIATQSNFPTDLSDTLFFSWSSDFVASPLILLVYHYLTGPIMITAAMTLCGARRDFTSLAAAGGSELILIDIQTSATDVYLLCWVLLGASSRMHSLPSERSPSSLSFNLCLHLGAAEPRFPLSVSWRMGFFGKWVLEKCVQQKHMR